MKTRKVVLIAFGAYLAVVVAVESLVGFMGARSFLRLDCR